MSVLFVKLTLLSFNVNQMHSSKGPKITVYFHRAAVRVVHKLVYNGNFGFALYCKKRVVYVFCLVTNQSFSFRSQPLFDSTYTMKLSFHVWEEVKAYRVVLKLTFDDAMMCKITKTKLQKTSMVFCEVTSGPEWLY